MHLSHIAYADGDFRDTMLQAGALPELLAHSQQHMCGTSPRGTHVISTLQLHEQHVQQQSQRQATSSLRNLLQEFAANRWFVQYVVDCPGLLQRMVQLLASLSHTVQVRMHTQHTLQQCTLMCSSSRTVDARVCACAV